MILASCSAPAADGNTNATVTVTSTGYGGSGFLVNPQGGSPNASKAVPVTPYQPPQPTILYFGQPNIPNPAYVGQQIALSRSTITLPAGYNETSDTWTICGTTGGYANCSTVIGGYVASSTLSGQVIALPTLTGPSVPGVTFYWTSTGGSQQVQYNVTFQYCVNNTTQCPSTTATFNVAGPTAPNGIFFTATTPQVTNLLPTGAVNVYPPGNANEGNSSHWWLEFGNGNGINGMSFATVANAVVPPVIDLNNPNQTNHASFQWVQLIGSINVQFLTNPATPNSVTQGPLLDNWYPYAVFTGQPNSTYDSPGHPLAAYSSPPTDPPTLIPLGELAEAFSATMYLMWDPALPSGCQPASTTEDPITKTISSTASNCTDSIPVPLGQVTWGFSGDTINTVPNQNISEQEWLLECGGPSPATPIVQPSSSYPPWSSTFTNSPNN